MAQFISVKRKMPVKGEVGAIKEKEIIINVEMIQSIVHAETEDEYYLYYSENGHSNAVVLSDQECERVKNLLPFLLPGRSEGSELRSLVTVLRDIHGILRARLRI